MPSIDKIQVSNTTYDIIDSDAVHKSSDVGVAGGVASLDEQGKLPIEQANTTQLIQGNNVQLTLNQETHQLTVSATDTTYSDATTSASGLMSVSDKTKLDSINMSSKEDVENKVPSISSTSTDTQYPSAKCVYDTTEDIREVAAGKTKNYVADLSSNPVFNTQAETVVISTFTTIDSVVHPASELQVGDNIYITDTGVPDRWCGAINSGIATMYKLETAKVPVNAVEVNSASVVDATGKASISVPYDDINANTTARHSHSNKNLLDTYTQTEVNISDAVSKKHSHSNSAVLNTITVSEQVRKIIVTDDTAETPIGNDGDIWLKYKA